MNIYVSNFGFEVQSQDLNQQFSRYGEVSSVNIIMDKLTNRSRGFAFVEMRDQNSAEKAIRELNGTNFEGRILKVNEAKRRD